MRGLLIAAVLCAAPAVAHAGVHFEGWDEDGSVVVEVTDPMAIWSTPWLGEDVDHSDFQAVCKPLPASDGDGEGGGACRVCTDPTSCNLTDDETTTKSSMKSRDKKIKATDKRTCIKDPEAQDGKRCTRTVKFGKKATVTYQENSSHDKAKLGVYFRSDSKVALVTFVGMGGMDGSIETSSMYVVDLEAGGGDVDAAILCGVVNGEDVQPVPSKKKPMLEDMVKCAIRETSGVAGTASVVTSWTTKDGGGKKVTHSGGAHQADIAVGTDAELDLSPAVTDGLIPDFTPCVDFQIDASITGKGGVVWTKTIKVAQKCKKPKAKLACTYPDPDTGKPIDELKKQYRLPAEAVVTCRLNGLDLVDHAAAAWIDAHSSQQQTRVKATLDSDTLVFTMNAGSDFGECDATDLDVVVVDDKDIPWFTKTWRVTEQCPD